MCQGGAGRKLPHDGRSLDRVEGIFKVNFDQDVIRVHVHVEAHYEAKCLGSSRRTLPELNRLARLLQGSLWHSFNETGDGS